MESDIRATRDDVASPGDTEHETIAKHPRSWESVVGRTARGKTGDEAENRPEHRRRSQERKRRRRPHDLRPQPARAHRTGGDHHHRAPGLHHHDHPAAGPRLQGATPNQAANFGAAGSRNGMVARLDAKGNAYVMALSKSTDGGRTWSSALAIPFSYDIAGQVGIASTNAYAVVGWDDTRNSDDGSKANIAPGGGLQDIYIAAAQFQAIGGGASSTAKVVLAGVVGLLVVGLMLVLAAVVTKRRTGGVSSSTTDAKNVGSNVG